MLQEKTEKKAEGRGYKISEKERQRRSENMSRVRTVRFGEANNKWEGDRVGIASLHQWVTFYRGSPKICEDCGTTTAKRYEWANPGHTYRRVLGEYKRLCKACHVKLDGLHRERDQKTGRFKRSE